MSPHETGAVVTETEICDILEREGPLTGAQLLERTRMEPLPLWIACRSSRAIWRETAGRRFLRLDRAVDGYARLSPSIRREFLTYTMLGLEAQSAQIHIAAERLRQQAREISRAKLGLAREAMAAVVDDLADRNRILDQVCFLIAGDVTYDMSHTVPRPETSTGQMVRGSDLDIIAVSTDELEEQTLTALDDAIYRKKHYLLVHPDYREEIDYVIKRLAKVRDQLQFDTFEHMVASKILHEGQLLYGSSTVFQAIKDLVARQGVPGKLAAMEQAAEEDRRAAEEHLLTVRSDQRTGEHFNLFYTREEGDEIY